MPADPNKADADGRTPLHHAVARRDAAAVKKLLESGADYERNDNAGNPPTHAMYDESRSFDRWIEFKLKKGYSKVFKVFTEFLYHPACKGSLAFINQEQLYNGIIDRSVARVKDALTQGGVWNLDIRLADGTTPLHLAASLGEARIVQALLAQKANPAARDHAGKTPHDVAIANGHAKVAALLVDKKKKAPSKRTSKRATAKTSKRATAKTLIGKLEDTAVSEVVDAVTGVYELEDFEEPLESILLVGDEISCSTLYLNVPGLHEMERIDETDGRRVEGRFFSDDDALELESESGLDVGYGAALLLYRVAARLEHDRGLWTIPTKGTIYVVYVDHSMNTINEDWRSVAKELVAKPIETYLHAVEQPAANATPTTKPKPKTQKKPRAKATKRK